VCTMCRSSVFRYIPYFYCFVHFWGCKLSPIFLSSVQCINETLCSYLSVCLWLSGTTGNLIFFLSRSCRQLSLPIRFQQFCEQKSDGIIVSCQECSVQLLLLHKLYQGLPGRGHPILQCDPWTNDSDPKFHKQH